MILLICSALQTVILSLAGDKSRDSSANSSKLEQMEWTSIVDLIDDNKLKNTWYKRADFWKDKVKANRHGGYK